MSGILWRMLNLLIVLGHYYCILFDQFLKYRIYTAYRTRRIEGVGAGGREKGYLYT